MPWPLAYWLGYTSESSPSLILTCENCQVQFNDLKSKYKCRLCNKNVCSDCSPASAVFSTSHCGSEDNERICKSCVDQMYTEQCVSITENNETSDDNIVTYSMINTEATSEDESDNQSSFTSLNVKVESSSEGTTALSNSGTHLILQSECSITSINVQVGSSSLGDSEMQSILPSQSSSTSLDVQMGSPSITVLSDSETQSILPSQSSSTSLDVQMGSPSTTVLSDSETQSILPSQYSTTSLDVQIGSPTEGNTVSSDSKNEIQSITSSQSSTSSLDIQTLLPDNPKLQLVPATLSPYFCMRETEQEILDGLLEMPNRTQPVDAAITGPPGVGKTELALKFIQQHCHRFHHIVWLKGETPEMIEESFKKIACEFKLINNDTKIIDINILIAKVYNHCSKFNSLFVFDNILCDILQYLPSVGIDKKSIFIFVTSQYTDWPCNINIPLKNFSALESVCFLKTQLSMASGEACLKLAKLLKNNSLPLLLQVIISYIKHQHKLLSLTGEDYSIDRFITEYKNSNDFILKHKILKSEGISYDKCLNEIWDMALNLVQHHEYGEMAMKILNMLSQMKSCSAPIEMFKTVLDSNGDETYLHAILLLKEYSLISNDCQNKIEISPLLQDNLKQSYTSMDDIENDIASLDLNDQENASNFSITEDMAKLWSDEIEDGEILERSDVAIKIMLNKKISDETRYDFLCQNEDIWTEISAWKNKEFLKSLCTLAQSLWEVNKCNEALRVSQLILQNQPQEYQDDWNTLDVLFCKAMCILSIGSNHKAIAILNNLYYKQKCKLEERSKDLMKILPAMCETACYLHCNGEERTLNHFLYTLNQIISEMKIDGHADMLEILNKMKNDLVWAGKEQLVINLYNALHLKVKECKKADQKIALEIAFCKGKFLYYDMKSYKDAQAVLLKVNSEQLQNGIDNSKTKKLLDEIDGMLQRKDEEEVSHLEEEFEKWDKLHKMRMAEFGASNHVTIRALLNKAVYLCKMGKTDSAWLTYETSCQLRGISAKPIPGDKDSLLKLIFSAKASIIEVY